MRIAYLAGNDVVSDARVRKYIATAVAAGHEVAAFGVTRQGGGHHGELSGAELVVVGTRPTVKERIASKWRQLRVVLRWGFPDHDAEVAARGQVARWRETASAKRGWRRAVLSAMATGGRAWLAVSRRLPTRAVSHVEPDDAARVAQVTALLAGPLDWRRELPVLVRDETSLGPVIDAWRPEVVHVHDVFGLAVACGVVDRAREAGRRCTMVYDAHEYVRGLSYIPVRTVAAYADLERRHIGRAERVVTVSEPLADLIESDHGLTRRPLVVLNAPMTAPLPDQLTTLREAVGVPAPVPLLVYGGGVNTARGVDTAVRALPELGDAHLAIVTNRVNYVVRALLELAADLGVADRVHLADYVEPELVPHYFADATIGLSTLMHSPNHDVALTNKFCEYLQAGLPIVTSDTPAQAVLVEELDLGAVYPAGDVPGLVAAVRAVLEDHDRLATRIAEDAALRHRFSWAAQADTITGMYVELAGQSAEEQA